MDYAPCPRCSDDGAEAGWTDSEAQCSLFQPDGIYRLRQLFWHFGESIHVRMPERFRPCQACGLIWNNLPPEAMRAAPAARQWPWATDRAPPRID